MAILLLTIINNKNKQRYDCIARDAFDGRLLDRVQLLPMQQVTVV